MSLIENLPDEILLKIFAFLQPKDVVQCLQVSTTFRRISKDETLWQKLHIQNEKIPVKLIGQVLGYGLRHLSFEYSYEYYYYTEILHRNFHLKQFDGRTDGRTDRLTDAATDKPSYRDAWAHPKKE